MLPVLWHHPLVCLGITHLDENGAKSYPNFGVANRDTPEKCVVVVTVDTTGLVKGGAMPPPPLQPLQPCDGIPRRCWRSLGRNFSDCAPTRDVRRPSYG